MTLTLISRRNLSCFSCSLQVTVVLMHAHLEQPSLSHSSQFLKEIKHMTPLMYESLSLLPPSHFVFLFFAVHFPLYFQLWFPRQSLNQMNSRCSSFTLTLYTALLNLYFLPNF